MKIIWLTQGQFTLVDDQDYEKVKSHNWYADKRGNKFYAVTFVKDGGNGKHVYMHRMILNTPDKKVTDHKDGNGLNNQRYNIRVCTQAENMRNQKPRVGYSSKLKGVFFHKLANKWTAQIKNNYKRIYLGLFTTEMEAAQAYDDAAIKLYGEYANLNFKK